MEAGYNSHTNCHRASESQFGGEGLFGEAGSFVVSPSAYYNYNSPPACSIKGREAPLVGQRNIQGMRQQQQQHSSSAAQETNSEEILARKLTFLTGSLVQGKPIRVDDLMSLRLDNESDPKAVQLLGNLHAELRLAAANSRQSGQLDPHLPVLNPPSADSSTDRKGTFDAHAVYAGDDAVSSVRWSHQATIGIRTALSALMSRYGLETYNPNPAVNQAPGAQNRTRAVIKAYNELESIASSLLRERRENHDASSPPRENSAANHGPSSSPTIDVDDELADVLFVDLTSDFDFEDGERAVVTQSRTPSPIFGLPGKTIKTKRSAEETMEATKSTRLGTTWNQIDTKSDSKTREGNEQDASPLGKTAWTRKSAEETNFPAVAEALKSTRLGTAWNQIGTKSDSKTREGNEQDASPLGKTAWTRKSAEETNFPGVAEAPKSTRLGIARNQIGTKTDSKTREGNEQDASRLGKTAWTRKSAEETNFPGVAEAPKSTRLGTASNQIGTKTDSKTRDGNEENSPLIGKSAAMIGASGSRDGESRPSLKLSLTKSTYRIDKSKAPGGKTTKQSTLVFQPIAAKVDITGSEKMKPQSNAARHRADLFDEDYRVRKTTAERESSLAAEKKDPPRAEKEKFDRSVEFLSRLSCEGTAARSTTKPDGPVYNFMFTETPSQIDESARSLFGDEDLEDFQISQDFLNTCMDAPALADLAKRTDDSGAERKIDEATSSTPKASQQPFNGLDSMDETFFAPGEFHPTSHLVKKPAKINKPVASCSTILTTKRLAEFQPTNNVVKKPAPVSKPVAGCSTILTPKRAGDKDRNLKRKTGEEPIDNDVLEDLDLRESDWDTDLWNENCPPVKRPLNNSFDIVPEKKRKSPEKFYKGKMGRGKNKVNKVTGWNCRECENYYGQMNLPEADLRRRLEACRRHTSKMPKYCTPKDFWNPEFPDTVNSSD